MTSGNAWEPGGRDTPRPDMYQLYRAADRTSPPAPVIAQAGGTRGLKPIVRPCHGSPDALHAPDLHGRLAVLHLGRRQSLEYESVLARLGRALLGDDDHLLARDPAEPRGEVHAVADGRVAERFRGAHVAHHHLAGVQPDADLQRLLSVGNPLGVELPELGLHLDGSLDRARRIVRPAHRSAPQAH